MISLAIKVGTAVLSYAMIVTLARLMDPAEYGLFAIGFALATFLGVAAGAGQQTAILRLWPEALVARDTKAARQAMGAGGAITLLASVGLTLVTLAGAGAYSLLNPGLPQAHFLAAALLIIPLAFAEYISSALRAQESIWLALLPRDIFWRLGVPVAAWGLFALGFVLTGSSAILMVAGLLYVMVGVQILTARGRYAGLLNFSGLKPYWARRGGASRWFWAATVIDSAALNLDIILVGLVLGSLEAGVYFNAARTASLMTLFMYAINVVIAPMISRHFHAGELNKAQAIASFCAWAGFAFSVLIFAGFALFGQPLLNLFGEAYGGGYWVLIILGMGYLFDAANGPTRVVMVMTGHERRYVTIIAYVNLMALAGFVIVIPIYGMLGAAVVNATGRMVVNIAISLWARRYVGIDPSLFGILTKKAGS
ncbi:MAG: oligosaccharide flippase family protein [Alphaproteobacteria bacterium]|nr:oligosaccharide flippase family protein [Alphaproteobacteria bacterium]